MSFFPFSYEAKSISIPRRRFRLCGSGGVTGHSDFLHGEANRSFPRSEVPLSLFVEFWAGSDNWCRGRSSLQNCESNLESCGFGRVEYDQGSGALAALPLWKILTCRRS